MKDYRTIQGAVYEHDYRNLVSAADSETELRADEVSTCFCPFG